MYKRKQIIKEFSRSEKLLETKLKGVSDVNTHEHPDKLHFKEALSTDDNYENEEWILFGDSYMDEFRNQQNKAEDVNSVLSTRLSGYQTVTHDILSSDIDNNYSDVAGDAQDDDDDSFINDIRESFRSINNIRVKELQEEFQNELVSKVNEWKTDIESPSASKSSSAFNSAAKAKQVSVSSPFQKEKEVKNLKKIVKHLYGALQKDTHNIKVKHEGIFMNNPDLESCIPSYWKRLMLDNMIYASEEQNGMLNVYVSRDDILNSRRHFWEVEESASISTGWESGTNIVGF